MYSLCFGLDSPAGAHSLRPACPSFAQEKINIPPFFYTSRFIAPKRNNLRCERAVPSTTKCCDFKTTRLYNINMPTPKKDLPLNLNISNATKKLNDKDAHTTGLIEDEIIRNAIPMAKVILLGQGRKVKGHIDDEAESLAWEAVGELLTSSCEFKNRQHFLGLLTTRMQRRAHAETNKLRKGKERAEVNLDSRPEPKSKQSELLEPDWVKVRNLLRERNPKLSDVFEGLMADKSTKEISSMSGIPLRTVQEYLKGRGENRMLKRKYLEEIKNCYEMVGDENQPRKHE